ncbi:MAG: hypothetical protein JNM18_01520, partial [Planctomycetaceae bacterium]|nr:hypothetical protein [Planctomycetaceae bacterium]
YGAISGRYNLWRTPTSLAAARFNASNVSGRDLVAGTERTPRQLCALCLNAMGERDYDLRLVPDQLRPTVNWNYANPARALAQLAEQLGCRVVLRTDDTVAIVQVGVGRDLPRDADVADVSMTFDPPELPAASVVVCGENLYQADLPLEAVGQDVDGSIRLLDELTYRAAFDWQFVDLDFMNEVTDPQSRDLARATVFRWYRVGTDLSNALPDELTALGVQRGHLLPLRSEQIETLMFSGVESAKPAQVFGSWYEPAQSISHENSVDSLQPVIAEDDSYAKSALYRKAFDFDAARGIVMFREPVYRLVGDPTEQTIHPAQLRLRTSFTIRDPATGAVRRYERRRGQSGARRADTRFVSLAEITPQWIVDYDPEYAISGVRHNLLDVHAAADESLNDLERQVFVARPESVGYVGLKRIDLDGAIQQVTWSVGLNGTTTRAARHTATDFLAPSLQESVLFTQRRGA